MTEPTPVQIDADGTRWWRFLFEYDWRGERYSFDIIATSRDDAEERLRRLPLARYVGQVSGNPITVPNILSRALGSLRLWRRR